MCYADFLESVNKTDVPMILKDKVVGEIAEETGKTPAQVPLLDACSL